MFEGAAHDLRQYGVAVVPYMDEPSRKMWETLLWKALDEMPEFQRRGRTVQRVLGGFGALGNPSSFHHPTVRAFRRKFKRLTAKTMLRHYVQAKYPAAYRSLRLEALFDRLCVRCEAFQRPTEEAWHRDIYDGDKYRLRQLPRTLPDGASDLLIGGWSNLDHRPQYFIGLVGTHEDPADSAVGGFAAYTKEQIRRFRFNETLKDQANRRFGHTIRCNERGEIVVPPGSALLFFQRLVHSVKSGPQPETPALRVFHGFRLTTEEASLFDHEGVLANGAVPRIPSGQMPPMYSQNHYAAFANPNEDKWRAWAARTFVDACLYRRETPSGLAYATPGSPANANAAANLGRYMPSLRELGLWNDAFEYGADEREALYPQLLFPPSSPSR